MPTSSITNQEIVNWASPETIALNFVACDVSDETIQTAVAHETMIRRNIIKNAITERARGFLTDHNKKRVELQREGEMLDSLRIWQEPAEIQQSAQLPYDIERPFYPFSLLTGHVEVGNTNDYYSLRNAALEIVFNDSTSKSEIDKSTKSKQISGFLNPLLRLADEDRNRYHWHKPLVAKAEQSGIEVYAGKGVTFAQPGEILRAMNTHSYIKGYGKQAIGTFLAFAQATTGIPE